MKEDVDLDDAIDSMEEIDDNEDRTIDFDVQFFSPLRNFPSFSLWCVLFCFWVLAGRRERVEKTESVCAMGRGENVCDGKRRESVLWEEESVYMLIILCFVG